jgi:hypothetical protein
MGVRGEQAAWKFVVEMGKKLLIALSSEQSVNIVHTLAAGGYDEDIELIAAR